MTGSGESNYVFASLIGDDPGVDDALSTLFMLIGKDAALPFVKKYNLKGYAFYDETTFTASTSMGGTESLPS